MSKLPLEELKEKYIPIEEFPAKYNINIARIMKLVEKGVLRYAEFKAPGSTRRSMHLNPEDVIPAIEKEGV